MDRRTEALQTSVNNAGAGLGYAAATRWQEELLVSAIGPNLAALQLEGGSTVFALSRMADVFVCTLQWGGLFGLGSSVTIAGSLLHCVEYLQERLAIMGSLMAYHMAYHMHATAGHHGQLDGVPHACNMHRCAWLLVAKQCTLIVMGCQLKAGASSGTPK
eukprot:1145046-Pelagomonas_calceolata.AAC.10